MTSILAAGHPASPPSTIALDDAAWPCRIALAAPTPATVFEDGLKLHHIANTAYPIAHRKTIWEYRVDEEIHEELISREFLNDEPMCLYAHVPFCQSRCRFCEYTVVADPSKEQQDSHHGAMLRELSLYTEHLGLHGKRLAGFDIGGGTPSFVDPQQIGRLVEAVKESFILEPEFGMSIETTPLIAARHPERLQAYRSFGIDRISMGLQMVSPALLKEYGRDLHEVGFNGPAVRNIRDAGYREFNIDLMYGFAKQQLSDFLFTLKATIDLSPDCITLYRVRYKGTRIAEEATNVDLDRINEAYEHAWKTLTEAGYLANPGKNTFSRNPQSPGTSAYLTKRVIEGMPYLGIGLGAQTFTGRILSYNLGAATKTLDEYINAVSAGRLPIQDMYDLPPAEGMAKMISVSFYFGEIDLPAFEQHFGVTLEEAFPEEISFLQEKGLMYYTGTKLRLTDTGVKNMPGIIAQFYSDRVKEHLHERACICQHPAVGAV